jgi:putative FmdB family regulatory protein
MPIYEYLCPKCGHHFEKLVKFNESPVCPSCECENPQRKFSLSAGISTGKTRGKAMGKARQQAGSVKKEQDHAQAEYERNYIRDHHDHE